MTDKDKPKEKTFESEFTGSVQSILRLDQLLKDCSFYSVNDILIGFKNNLREILKEGQGYLSSQELKKAVKDWDEIESFDIVVDENNMVVKFDHDLLKKLHKFDFWVRMRLFKRGALMGSKKEHAFGMKKLMKKYGINQDE